MRTWSGAVKIGKCLCFYWNEVRPVVNHSVPAVSGWELQLTSGGGCWLEEGETVDVRGSYSIYLMQVSMQYCEKNIVFMFLGLYEC